MQKVVSSLSGQKKIMTADMTLGQLTDKLDKRPDTMRKFWNRMADKFPDIFTERGYDPERELSADQINILSGKSGVKSAKLSGKTGQLKSAVSVRPAEKPATPKLEKQPAPEVAPEPEPLQKKQQLRIPVFGLSELLSVVIYAHTALVWYEVALIFGMPGVFAGVILAALKHAAVVASKNPDYDRFTADTLGVAFVLDALAVYAHYTAFREALPGNFAQQMGNGGSFWAACVLAVVVASGAFISLYFINEIRKTK